MERITTAARRSIEASSAEAGFLFVFSAGFCRRPYVALPPSVSGGATGSIEISSKKPVRRFREVIQAHTKVFLICNQDRELKSVATECTKNDTLAVHQKKERGAAKKGTYYLKKSEIQKQKLAEKSAQGMG